MKYRRSPVVPGGHLPQLQQGLLTGRRLAVLDNQILPGGLFVLKRPAQTQPSQQAAVFKYRIQIAPGNNAASIHHNHSIGQTGCSSKAMLHQHDGHAQAAAQLLQAGDYQRSSLHVQRGCRLVQHQHLRAHGQRRGDCHTLLLPARKLCRVAAGQIRDSDCTQRPCHPLLDFVFIQSEIARSKGHLIGNMQVEELAGRVLENDSYMAGHISDGSLTGIQTSDHNFSAALRRDDLGDQSGERPGQRALTTA